MHKKGLRQLFFVHTNRVLQSSGGPAVSLQAAQRGSAAKPGAAKQQIGQRAALTHP